MNEWPFDQPKNCGTVISRAVIDGKKEIVCVIHCDDDHSWQFLDDETFEPEQAALVCLSNVVELDSTVLEIADLEPGWMASRKNMGGKWIREKMED